MSSYSTQCHLCKTILQVRRRHRAAAAVARATWKVACSRLVPWCDVTLSAVLPPSRCCQLKGSASSVRAQKLSRQQHVNVAITCQLGQIFRTLFSLSSAACCFLSKFCHVRLTFCLMAREAAWLQISVRQCFWRMLKLRWKSGNIIKSFQFPSIALLFEESVFFVREASLREIWFNASEVIFNFKTTPIPGSVSRFQRVVTWELKFCCVIALLTWSGKGTLTVL